MSESVSRGLIVLINDSFFLLMRMLRDYSGEKREYFEVTIENLKLFK